MIVTNGRTARQEAKIRRTGWGRIVRGRVVSEAAGCRKPAPEIFRTAGATAGASLRGAWMIGDSPHAGIGGANALDGVRSVWVPAGRPRTEPAFRPTHVTGGIASAVTYVVDRRPHEAPAVRS